MAPTSDLEKKTNESHPVRDIGMAIVDTLTFPIPYYGQKRVIELLEGKSVWKKGAAATAVSLMQGYMGIELIMMTKYLGN